ncbi:MAG: hypothetical protein NTU80_03030 [Verrucomicrobia bacterium]|nr:hypothetical protein [Verrucomicrobiota bacterium]
MASPLRSLLCISTVFVLCAAGLRADEPLAILDRARAYLGEEAALTSVTGLRMVGKLEVTSAGTADSPPAQLEILFQQPFRQRISATTANQVEVTALDGYDAWQRVTDAADTNNTTRWQITLLGPDQIKRLRANTFENLSFYRGLTNQGGKIEDRGPATVDGIPCRKIAFIHAPDIVFIRSFELATGRLVLTETDSGTQIREEGEIKVAGLRFPQRISTTAQLPDGSTRTIRVTFSTVDVNPVIDPAAFAIPTLNP